MANPNTTVDTLLTADNDDAAILAMMDYLSLTDLLNFRAVSRATRSLVTTTLRLRWHRSLHRFIADPLRFRALLHTTQSVVSGSVVLFYALSNTRFVNGWKPDDMDIYCPLVSAVPIIDYLVQHERYTVHSRHVNKPYPGSTSPSSRSQSRSSSNTNNNASARSSEYTHNGGIAAVIHLARPDGTNIDVVCSTRPSALAPLPSFWSTLVLNYVDADKLCISYPQLTLRGHACLNPRYATRSRTARCVEKYTARGFGVREFKEESVGCMPELGKRMSCPHTTRSFGDAGCLVMPMEEGTAPSYGEDGVRLLGLKQFVSWRYGGKTCGGGCGSSSRQFVAVRRVAPEL